MSDNTDTNQLKEKLAKEIMQGTNHGGKPVDLTDRNFHDAVGKADYMIIDFWAPWCGPCRFVSPILEEIAKDYKDKVVVGKVNVDDNPMVSSEFMINSIPTIMFFKKGQHVDTMIGAAPKPMIEQRVKEYL